MRITLCVVLACMICACSQSSNPPAVTSQQQATLASLTTLKFPPSTQYLGYRYDEEFLDDNMCAKVEIPVGDIQAFIDSSPFTGQTLHSKRSELSDREDLDWFKPGTAKNFESGSVWLPEGKALVITLDYDRDDFVVVYIGWFET